VVTCTCYLGEELERLFLLQVAHVVLDVLLKHRHHLGPAEERFQIYLTRDSLQNIQVANIINLIKTFGENAYYDGIGLPYAV